MFSAPCGAVSQSRTCGGAGTPSRKYGVFPTQTSSSSPQRFRSAASSLASASLRPLQVIDPCFSEINSYHLSAIPAPPSSWLSVGAELEESRSMTTSALFLFDRNAGLSPARDPGATRRRRLSFLKPWELRRFGRAHVFGPSYERRTMSSAGTRPQRGGACGNRTRCVVPLSRSLPPGGKVSRPWP